MNTYKSFRVYGLCEVSYPAEQPPEENPRPSRTAAYCRWKIERLLAGLHNFRRLVNRWDYPETDVLGML